MTRESQVAQQQPAQPQQAVAQPQQQQPEKHQIQADSETAYNDLLEKFNSGLQTIIETYVVININQAAGNAEFQKLNPVAQAHLNTIYTQFSQKARNPLYIEKIVTESVLLLKLAKPNDATKRLQNSLSVLFAECFIPSKKCARDFLAHLEAIFQRQTLLVGSAESFRTKAVAVKKKKDVYKTNYRAREAEVVELNKTNRDLTKQVLSMSMALGPKKGNTSMFGTSIVQVDAIQCKDKDKLTKIVSNTKLEIIVNLSAYIKDGNKPTDLISRAWKLLIEILEGILKLEEIVEIASNSNKFVYTQKIRPLLRAELNNVLNINDDNLSQMRANDEFSILLSNLLALTNNEDADQVKSALVQSAAKVGLSETKKSICYTLKQLFESGELLPKDDQLAGKYKEAGERLKSAIAKEKENVQGESTKAVLAVINK